jgi:hypothetical protein
MCTTVTGLNGVSRSGREPFGGSGVAAQKDRFRMMPFDQGLTAVPGNTPAIPNPPPEVPPLTPGEVPPAPPVESPPDAEPQGIPVEPPPELPPNAPPEAPPATPIDLPPGRNPRQPQE